MRSNILKNFYRSNKISILLPGDYFTWIEQSLEDIDSSIPIPVVQILDENGFSIFTNIVEETYYKKDFSEEELTKILNYIKSNIKRIFVPFLPYPQSTGNIYVLQNDEWWVNDLADSDAIFYLGKHSDMLQTLNLLGFMFPDQKDMSDLGLDRESAINSMKLLRTHKDNIN